jgi:uncharacterized protein (DUF58 family)
MCPLSEMMSSSMTEVVTGAYCDLQELIRLRFGAREINLGRQRKAFSQLVGPHQTRFRSRGIEFEEVRAYQAGDDIRSIDWRVTARTGKPHTKMFREERERPVMLMVDQRLSMFFGSKTCFKSVMAAHTAALLAWAAFQNNDRVGGLVFNDEGHQEVRPKRNARTVLRLLSSIDSLNHQLSRRVTRGESGVDQAIEELRRITRPGSNLFIISDFHDLGNEGLKHLYLLSKNNDITAVRIYDPLEEHLPPKGAYSITNGEHRFMMNTGDRALCRRYHQRFTQQGHALASLLGPMGIPVMTMSTIESPLRYFRKMLGRGK